jgi:hypothetical protein
MPYRNRGAVLNFALLFEMIHKQLANSHTARFKLGQLPLKFCACPNKEAANSGGLTPAIFENGCSLYNGWLRPMELFAYCNCMFASCLQFLKPVVIFLSPFARRGHSATSDDFDSVFIMGRGRYLRCPILLTWQIWPLTFQIRTSVVRLRRAYAPQELRVHFWPK